MNTIPINIKIESNDIGLIVGGGSVGNIPIGVDTAIITSTNEHYQGEYDFTPTSERQFISITGMIADEDIIIEPIPSNYGLITWNGSIITIT